MTIVSNIAVRAKNVDVHDPDDTTRIYKFVKDLEYPHGLTPPLSETGASDREVGAYMVYSAFKYERGIGAVGKNELGERIFSIALPMPGNIAQAYNAEWAQFEAGVAGLAAATFSSGKGAGAATAGVIGAAAGGAISGLLGSITEKLQGTSGAMFNGAMEAATAEQTKSTVSSATGLSFNPRREMAFNSMQIRQHSFQYTLTPANSAEASTCEAIIKNFRGAMHSETKGISRIGLEYPYEFVIEFYGPNGERLNYPSVIPDSYMTSFQVVVNPGFATARLHQDNTHIQYQITMAFTESVALSRNDLQLLESDRGIIGDGGV